MRRCIPLIYALLIIANFSSCSNRAESAGPAVPAISDALYKNSLLSVDERIDDLVGRMTVMEKAAQTAQVARGYIKFKDDLRTYGLGSILSGGGSTPRPNTPAAWADMIDGYQVLALESRLGIPIIYGADAVHGHNNLRGATIFPHNIGLGATGNPELVERITRVTAIETLATGVRWTFAPCVAVPQDERWGRTYEGFSEDPTLTAILASASVRGYQGTGLGSPDSILATAKHFIADGGTDGGVDQGDFSGIEEDLRTIHLPPYKSAITAGTGSVMASFSSWNGSKVHGSRKLLTGLLRDELGFEGLLVSDWAAIRQLPGTSGDQIKTALEAGIDMVMLPDRYKEYILLLTELVETEQLSTTHLDRAVKNILRVKFAMGLFEIPYTDRSNIDDIGSDEHRGVARDAVRQSLVLLKNENGVLPLSRDMIVGIAGRRADDIGSQCGGWTITWQGEPGDITDGTTVLEAFREALGTDQITYAMDGKFRKSPDVVIAVVGETPYAEFTGDRDDLRLEVSDRELVDRLSGGKIPLITLLINGRPMIVTEEIEKSDAFMALWLPGTEGSGIADVLLGESPVGRLPHTWPRSMDQIPINDGDGQVPLFPIGYGLSW